MIEPANLSRRADTLRIAAAAAVIVESLGMSAPEAFEWIKDASSVTGIPALELTDLVLQEAIRGQSR